VALLELSVAAGVTAIAGMTLAVRHPRVMWLAPSIAEGPPDRKAVAITFDDGPSESTPQLLDLLEQHGGRGTFFACGSHVERLPAVARDILARGHELANHTQSHAALYLKSPAFILSQLTQAQSSIASVTGFTPDLFRPTYGCRWFGLAEAQRRLGLTSIMWTTIALDWKLDGRGVAQVLRRGLRPGAIFCLHDGREMRDNPDIRSTCEGLAAVLPEWKRQGYEFLTVSQLLCRTPRNG